MLTPFNNANNSPENFNEPMGDLAMQMPGGYTPASPNKKLYLPAVNGRMILTDWRTFTIPPTGAKE